MRSGDEMKLARWFAGAGVAIAMTASSVAHAGYSNLYVFGDNLSDNGNVAEAFYRQNFPNPPSYHDSFTNGPVAAEIPGQPDRRLAHAFAVHHGLQGCVRAFRRRVVRAGHELRGRGLHGRGHPGFRRASPTRTCRNRSRRTVPSSRGSQIRTRCTSFSPAATTCGRLRCMAWAPPASRPASATSSRRSRC